MLMNKLFPHKSNLGIYRMTLMKVKDIVKFVGFTIASKTTIEEARKQLLSYLFSNDTWKKISK